MVFLNSIALWGTLAAVGIAVPILIHLFNRLRHRTIDWGAMEFLRRAMVVRARRIRLEDVILMALRCLALLLLALALARPTWRGAQLAWLGGTEVGALIALDGSFSMAHGGNFTRFDRARQRAAEVCGSLQPGQPVTLLVMGDRPHILLRNVGYEKETFEKVLAEQARVYPERLRLEANLEEIEDLMRELKAASRECYLVTDAQAVSWESLSDKARASLTALTGIARVFLVSAAPDRGENLALTSLDLAGGALRKGALATFEAEVRNFGQRAAHGVTVQLKASSAGFQPATQDAGRMPALHGRTVDQRIIENLEPGKTDGVSLYFRCTEPGDVKLTAGFGPDQLTLDNERCAVAHVREALKVLCVDGRVQAQPFKSSTDYLLTAFQPKRSGAWLSVDLRRVPNSGLGAEPLEEFDFIVLANVAELPAEQALRLKAFVEKGGGAMIFLGEQVQAPLFNRWAGEEGAHLAPLELLELAGSADANVQRSAGILPATGAGETPALLGWSAAPVASGHPLGRCVARLSSKVVATPRVRAFFKSKLKPGASEILRVAGTEFPLLAACRVGRGQVLMFTTSADTAWTDLPLHPLYFILVNEGLSCLSRAPHEEPLAVCAPVHLPLPAAVEPGRTVLRDAEGQEWELAPREKDGLKVIEHPGLPKPGFYEVVLPGKLAPLTLAANLDPVESDIRALVGAGWGAPFRGLAVHVLDNEGDLAEAIQASRIGRELWSYLLVLVLAILVLESYLARRFSKVVSLAGAPWLTRRPGGQAA